MHGSSRITRSSSSVTADVFRGSATAICASRSASDSTASLHLESVESRLHDQSNVRISLIASSHDRPGDRATDSRYRAWRMAPSMTPLESISSPPLERRQRKLLATDRDLKCSTEPAFPDAGRGAAPDGGLPKARPSPERDAHGPQAAENRT